jgi:hypothetical protein
MKEVLKNPERCVKLFLDLCPLCFASKKRKAENKVPLKMIYSPEFGHRAQIDLIDMTTKSVYGYNYILCYVDHLSGFAHVACTKSKQAEEVGIKLCHILSTAVTPEILQSDNGNEFLGKCIEMIKTFYGFLHMFVVELTTPNHKVKWNGVMQHLRKPSKNGWKLMVRTGL